MQSLLTAGDVFSKVFEIAVNKWIKSCQAKHCRLLAILILVTSCLRCQFSVVLKN